MRVYRDEPELSLQIARARDGDATARAWLVERWTAPVFRFCRRILQNDEDARDATQDTMVKVLRHLSRYDPDRSFSTWVFGIARNTCIDEHRRRSRRTWDEPGEIPSESPDPLQHTSSNERAAQIQRALDQLPPMYREVLVLYHFEHLKYAEIADVLELPLGTVMNRIFRARRKLRTLYVEAGGER